MNAAQQELVRTTFARLAVMPEVAGALFYERLFAISPSFRSLFENDMRVQGVKLMTMLAMVVYNLPEPGQVLPAIHDMALRHVEYGVKLADPTRCGKRCSGLSNRCWGWTSSPRSGKRGWSARTNSRVR